jgi:hypothetical protein
MNAALYKKTFMMDETTLGNVHEDCTAYENPVEDSKVQK